MQACLIIHVLALFNFYEIIKEITGIAKINDNSGWTEVILKKFDWILTSKNGGLENDPDNYDNYGLKLRSLMRRFENVVSYSIT